MLRLIPVVCLRGRMHLISGSVKLDGLYSQVPSHTVLGYQVPSKGSDGQGVKHNEPVDLISFSQINCAGEDLALRTDEVPQLHCQLLVGQFWRWNARSVDADWIAPQYLHRRDRESPRLPRPDIVQQDILGHLRQQSGLRLS